MQVRSLKRREIRIVTRGKDLAALRDGLRIGQIVRGRVLEILAGGRIVLSLKGYRLMAETRGISVNTGQTLALLVKDLTEKIELKWVQSQQLLPKCGQNISSLTLSRLLGNLHRLQGLLFGVLTSSKRFLRLKRSWERLRNKAYRGPLFLAGIGDIDRQGFIPGEVVTQYGGFPSMLRIFEEQEENTVSERTTDDRWFEWCMESNIFGPVFFLVLRQDGRLHCRCFVLDDLVSFFTMYVNKLSSRLEKSNNIFVDAAVVGLNEEMPEILNMMDHLSEEYINVRV